MRINWFITKHHNSALSYTLNKLSNNCPFALKGINNLTWSQLEIIPEHLDTNILLCAFMCLVLLERYKKVFIDLTWLYFTVVLWPVWLYSFCLTVPIRFRIIYLLTLQWIRGRFQKWQKFVLSYLCYLFIYLRNRIKVAVKMHIIFSK